MTTQHNLVQRRYVDCSATLQRGQYSGYRFNPQAKVVSNVLARHQQQDGIARFSQFGEL